MKQRIPRATRLPSHQGFGGSFHLAVASFATRRLSSTAQIRTPSLVCFRLNWNRRTIPAQSPRSLPIGNPARTVVRSCLTPFKRNKGIHHRRGLQLQGKPASRCVYIWVDKDFAMYRGWIQGFSKKLASIHILALMLSVNHPAS